jgi:hypothetical protein
MFRAGAPFAIIALACSLGCESLSGLSGGSLDAGSDARHDVDATSKQDAHAIDAAHEAAPRQDASRDGSGGGSGDASADARAATDAQDAGGCVNGVAVLANSGAVANPTGLAMQTHVVYAENTLAWWLFYIDSAHPNLLKTRWSSDFCTWNDGAALMLPYAHGSEGRNYSVSYSSLAGHDVIHVSFSHYVSTTERYHTHTRAEISGSTISFDAPVLISSILTSTSYPIDPDGPVTAVGSDGIVTDLSAWIDEGSGHIDDALAWRSVNPDTGSMWTNAWNAYQLLTYVPNVVNARAIASLPGGGVLALWEDGSAEPDPDNVQWAVWSGSAWGSVANVFPDSTTQGVNDWSVLPLASGDTHAVRRTLSSGFEHERFNGTTWSSGGTIPEDPGQLDTGVFLASTSATSIALYAIGEGTSVIRTLAWTGGAWADGWTNAVSANGTPSFLGGYASPTARKAAIIWTEASSGGTYQVVGMLVPQQ